MRSVETISDGHSQLYSVVDERKFDDPIQVSSKTDALSNELSPFGRDPLLYRVDAKDATLLAREPQPLRILVPVTVEVLEQSPFACVDARNLYQRKLLSEDFYDVALLYDGEDNLSRLQRRFLFRDELQKIEQKIKAHARAAKEAKLSQDLGIFDYVPWNLLQEYFLVRGYVIQALVERMVQNDPGELERYRKHVRPFALALWDMEQNGIKVDKTRAQQGAAALDLMRGRGLSSQWNCWAAHEVKFIRSMIDLADEEDFVHSMISPVGVKTGRCRVEGGFQCMGIPHGICREMVISRFEGGEIWSLDFNAIDYRCMVAAVGGPLAELYRGCPDFHARTMELASGSYDPEQREIFKKVTYVYLYGGSDRTLAQTSGLTQEGIQELLSKLSFLRPIVEFRDTLWKMALKDEYVTVPQGGGRVKIEQDCSPGKALGLFAQGFASQVFARSVIAATELMKNGKSRPIFPVHDELVVDAHPLDHLEKALVTTMQEAAGKGFVVKLQKGKNYADATR